MKRYVTATCLLAYNLAWQRGTVYARSGLRCCKGEGNESGRVDWGGVVSEGGEPRDEVVSGWGGWRVDGEKGGGAGWSGD